MMAQLDQLRSLYAYFPTPELKAEIERLVALQRGGAPQTMPQSFMMPNPLALNQQQLNIGGASAPELQSANYRRPVTTGSDFIP